MKISAINNYCFSKINFESKKSKNIQAPAHTSSPVKAIPVALLIAMSPVNAPHTTAQVHQSQMELVQNPQDELVDQYVCLNATPDGNSGKIKMYTTRDGEDYIKLNLTKKAEAFAFNKNNEIVDVIKTYKIEIRPEEFLIENISYSGKGKYSKERKYYVIGSGIQYVTNITDAKTGEEIPKSSFEDTIKLEGKKYEITEDFYEAIKQNAYNTSPTVEENSLIFTSGRK